MAEPQLTTSPDQETAYLATIDGAAYRQQVFTVTSPTWANGQATNMPFQGGTNVSEGVRIMDENNQDITQVKVSSTRDGYKGTFKALYPEDCAAGQSGSVQLFLSAGVYQYAVFYASCQEVDQYDNLQSYLYDTGPRVNLLRNATSNYSDIDEPDDSDEPTPPPSETALKIIEYEAGTTVILSGATFEVAGPDGDIISIYIMPESGSITVPLTEVGNYAIYEWIPPEYHLLGEGPVRQVTVRCGKTAEMDFGNEPYDDPRIEKTDAPIGASLAEARIQVKYVENGVTYIDTTGTGGSYTFTELKSGAYEIRELPAPEGWEQDSQAYTTTVVVGDCVTYTLRNEGLSSLKIIKYDRESHEIVLGVTFRIWWDGELLGNYETDASGEVLLMDCRPGTYRIQRVDTGDSGCLAGSTPQGTELKAGDGIKELYSLDDQEPKIWLAKVDSVNPSKVIPNAKSHIKAVGGSSGPAEFVTN